MIERLGLGSDQSVPSVIPRVTAKLQVACPQAGAGAAACILQFSVVVEGSKGFLRAPEYSGLAGAGAWDAWSPWATRHWA